MFGESDISIIIEATHYAALMHKDQRRKGIDKIPYINHPLEVAKVLWETGKVRNTDIIAAAILHDTIEDTDTEYEDLVKLFGENIANLVAEVTDDKSLQKPERKRLQVEKASSKSEGAKQIKIADKICNTKDLINGPPEWSLQRKKDYLDWSDKVFSGLIGVNSNLESLYLETVEKSRKYLNSL